MSESKQNNSRESGVNPVEPAQQPLGAEEKISQGRRRFAKAGLLGPPILMSVASRPVLGALGQPCISNMLSGNLSHPQRGSCVLGISPADWIGIASWPSPIDKGTPPMGSSLNCDDCDENPDPDVVSWVCGGTLFNTIFTSSDDSRPMYQILCDDPNLDAPTQESAFVAAYLNALTYDYVLSPMQVQDLWNGDYVHVSDKTAFLIRTWTQGAWDGTW